MKFTAQWLKFFNFSFDYKVKILKLTQFELSKIVCTSVLLAKIRFLVLVNEQLLFFWQQRKKMSCMQKRLFSSFPFLSCHNSFIQKFLISQLFFKNVKKSSLGWKALGSTSSLLTFLQKNE